MWSNALTLLYNSITVVYAGTIKENLDNQLLPVFFSIEKMLNAKPTKKLPSHNKPLDLAEKVVSFFDLKV